MKFIIWFCALPNVRLWCLKKPLFYKDECGVNQTESFGIGEECHKDDKIL